MRHRNQGRKLGLTSGHRKAMLRQLVEALFLHGRIRTTVTRAKEARPIAERVITWAKKGTLHHRRMAFALIWRKDVVNRIFDHMVEWYRTRPGGYTRIIKLGVRPGDSAPMAYLELVDWVSGGEKLTGQMVKMEKKVEGEEGMEGKDKDKEKEKKEKEKKEKEKVKAAKKVKVESAAKAKEKEKVPKDPAKEKKIAERQAAREKQKQERTVLREKAKKEKQEQKESGKKGEGKKAQAPTKAVKPAKGKDKK